MCRLLETIKVEDRRFHNLPYHTARMNRARSELFSRTDPVDLVSHLEVPDEIDGRRHKCRITYGEEITGIEFELYKIRKIDSLKVVDGSGIDYRYKFVDRSTLAALRDLRGECDEIIIAIDGHVTDASYANLAFFNGSDWITPASPLLEGTKRASLIDKDMVKVANIRVDRLQDFTRVALINALLDLDECVVPISAVQF